VLGEALDLLVDGVVEEDAGGGDDNLADLAAGGVIGGAEVEEDVANLGVGEERGEDDLKARGSAAGGEPVEVSFWRSCARAAASSWDGVTSPPGPPLHLRGEGETFPQMDADGLAAARLRYSLGWGRVDVGVVGGTLTGVGW
jgi:hypothetical protein